ncbi:MAG: IS4 family transposase [Verrucomicrobia bacterium]|nr:IS4 family transposase [Cytophagales bacterium]
MKTFTTPIFNFGDKRLNARGIGLLEAMKKEQSSVIHRLGNWATQIAFYRFINNERVKRDQIQQALRQTCQQVIEQDTIEQKKEEQTHYLILQDTTAVSLSSHKGRISKEIGWIANKSEDIGYFIHPSLVINAQAGMPVGFAHVRSWTRAKSAKDRFERNYKQQSIADKESFRWIESMQESSKLFAPTHQLTFIQDREGDIFELFQEATAQKRFIVRSKANRKLLANGEQANKEQANKEQANKEQANKELLYDYMKQVSLSTTFDIEVIKEVRKNRAAREALLEIRFSAVLLAPPARRKGDKPISLWAVWACESEQTIPKGEEGISWHLLVSYPIETIEAALEAIKFYRQRWWIEELFRLLKSEGWGLEASELESGEAIMKMAVLTLFPALQVLTLWFSWKEENPLEVKGLFSETETKCMEILNEKLEGKSQKQKNPYPRGSLQRIAWVIARLEGWSGYSSQRKPGIITFWNGMKKFQAIFQGYLLKDVYKP